MEENKDQKQRDSFAGLLGRTKISTQMAVVYLLAIVLPITILGGLLMRVTYVNQKSYHADLLESYNAGIKRTMYEMTSQIYTFSESIVYNDELIGFLRGEYETENDLRAAAREITLMDDYMKSYAGIEEVLVYIDREDMINYGQYRVPTEEIKATEWYQKAQNQFSPFWISYRVKNPTNNEYVWRLALVRKMILVGGDKEAVVMIKIKDSYLASRIGDYEYLTMISVDDTPVSFSNQTKYYGTMPAFEFHPEDKYDYGGVTELEGEEVLFHVSSLDISRTSSNIYLMTYDISAIENMERMFFTYGAVLSVTMLLTMVILVSFSGSIVHQVKGLRVEMGKASRGEYDSMLTKFRASRELTEAFEDLHVMVKNIQEMEAAQYEAEIKEQNIQNEQQKMEFKMLASQINPHFLYNTLESIRMKAFTAGDKEVANAIKLLGKSMRYVLENTGTADTSLQAEIDHILTYLQIQQLRFGDRVNYILTVEPGMNLEEYRVLPLLLQPIVENGIVHGLESRESDGTIWISIYVQDNVVYTDISDNGCGMDEETLQTVMAKVENYTRKRHKSSIGLYNINRRIKLNYGEQYGLDIQSTLGEGTMVRVTFPVIKTQEESIETH
ncbi:MAG: sensor histidine kinase [Lachnospiraceae bacterium]|nr:sensor histidine kinase [Lachnospiraceae bacterium]